MKKQAFFKGVYIMLIALCVCLMGCSENKKETDNQIQQKKISWDLVNTDAKNIDIENLKKLLIIFETSCKGLQQYQDVIEKKEIQVIKYRKGDNASYTEEKYGWLTEAVITLSVKKDAKLPSFLSMAKGVTLYYHAGAGHTPGLVITKDIAALFYGVDKNKITNGGNTFVAEKSYSIVDSIITYASYSKILTLDSFIQEYNKMAESYSITKVSNADIEKGASIDVLHWTSNTANEITVYFRQDDVRSFSSASIICNTTSLENIKPILAALVSVIEGKIQDEIENEVINILSHKDKDDYRTNTGLLYKVRSRENGIAISMTAQ
jgi:hypothetical protein